MGKSGGEKFSGEKGNKPNKEETPTSPPAPAINQIPTQAQTGPLPTCSEWEASREIKDLYGSLKTVFHIKHDSKKPDAACHALNDKLASLSTLNLSFTSLTNNGVDILSKFENIEHLLAVGTKINYAKLTEDQQALFNVPAGHIKGSTGQPKEGLVALLTKELFSTFFKTTHTAGKLHQNKASELGLALIGWSMENEYNEKEPPLISLIDEENFKITGNIQSTSIGSDDLTLRCEFEITVNKDTDLDVSELDEKKKSWKCRKAGAAGQWVQRVEILGKVADKISQPKKDKKTGKKVKASRVQRAAMGFAGGISGIS